MKKIDIEDLRSIQLGILKHFDNYCKENEIHYFLSNGTALGAVKYGGFIPWDDDIDVCVPRADYTKLIAKYPLNNYDSRYHLYACETNDNYLFPFAKMSDETTVIKENNVDNGVKLGVNIDIFPLDGFGNSEEEAKCIFKRMEKLRHRLHWAKMCDFRSTNPLKNLAKRIISARYKFVGARKYCLQISDYAQSLPYLSEYIGDCTWGFYGVGEAHRCEIFADSVKVTFEGEKYPVPIGYDQYLRGLYGDYKVDPPLEKQVTHHNFYAYYKEKV